MKKTTILILVYVTVVTAIIISVKTIRASYGHSAPQSALLADCNDHNPGPNGGE